jgi:porphobilinogen synthase
MTDATSSSPPQSEVSQSTQPVTTHRPRRLRRTETLRRMVRENTLRVDDLIYPLFVMEGEGQREAIPSMPGCYRYTLDLLLQEVREGYEMGIGAIALFPLIPHDQKDNAGTESYNPDGLIPRAVRGADLILTYFAKEVALMLR